MKEFEKLPKRVRKIVEVCRRGQILCRSYRPRALGEERDVLMYWYEPGGWPAPSLSCGEAIAEGWLKPLDAGLFQDGNAQSFIAVPE